MSDDDRMIQEAATAYCARDPEYKRVRSLRGATPSFDRETWNSLAEMGWTGFRIPEACGGSALTFHQVTLILEQYGRSLSPEPLAPIAVLVAGVLARSVSDAKASWLRRLAAGTWLPTLAWQEEGLAPHCAEPVTTRAEVRGNGRIFLHGRKYFVPVVEAADAFVVSARSKDGCGLYLVSRDAAGVTITPHRRVDGGTWGDVALQDVLVDAGAVVATGSHATDSLELALDEARLAAGAELVGVMSAVFDMTIEYLKVRRQFDKPIGSFQALQHRAVDLYMQVEVSRAVLRQAAAVFDASTDTRRRATVASQLKARTSDAALTVAKGAVHLHGGMGYTDECNVGLFLKRAMVLSAWLGNSRAHRQRYGALVEASPSGGQADSDEPRTPLQQEARAFAEAHFPPEWRFPPYRINLVRARPWLRKLYEKGWGAPNWPVEFGGMGLSAYDQVKLQEEFDRYGIFLTPNASVNMLGPLLIRYGSEDQRKKHLPKIPSAEKLWAQGYSEPGAGSDLASLRTTAVLDGDEFVVNGQKIWTSDANHYDMIFMLVRTDPKAKKHEGISLLLVDLKSPGITVRPIVNLAGETSFCEVFFDNVRVPKDNLVGEMNRAWSMAKSVLGSERIMIGHPKLARYPLELLSRLLHSRGLWDDPALRARFEELRLDVVDLGAAFVSVVDVLRSGREVGPEVSILKIWVSETFQRIADMLLDVGGERTVIDESEPLADGTSIHVANQYFLARPASIYAGTNDIQRNIVAKAVLGLPG
jgi:alkylation response protein AidB-like acyl-CoA dehydrogenase